MAKQTRSTKVVASTSAPKTATRKSDEPFDRKAELASLQADINKAFKGRAIVRSGDEIQNAFILRRPTGITSIDLGIGGGFPAGGLAQIIGRDSSGKSYLTNRTMANTQAIYGQESAISICMTEMPFDKAFAKWHCGLAIAFSEAEIEILERVNTQYGRPSYTDEQRAWLRHQVGTVYETRAATAEQLLEIAVQHVESNLFQIVMIDSFGALLTAAEAEAEEGLEQKHRGGSAMVITQFMHRLHAALNMPDERGNMNTTTVLGINQYRDNVTAGLYGNPMKIAGGWALRHGKLVDLHLEQGKKHRIQIGTEYYIIGKEINWEVIKGKAGCHDGPKGTYNFYFGEHGYGFGVDVFSDLVVAGLQHGVVSQSGAWYSFNGDKLGQGKDGVGQALSQNPALFDAIRKEIFKKAGLNFVTKLDDD